MTAARLLLHCRGVVQGVGFRPAAFRLARALGLTGQIANDPARVRLDLSGSRQALERFVADLPAALPPRLGWSHFNRNGYPSSTTPRLSC